MSNSIRAGIIGGAGYTGGELLRLLLHHPFAEIAFVHSSSHAGKPIHTVHTDLVGETDLHFTDAISSEIDVLFLCLGHGASAEFLRGQSLPSTIRLIDLSQDFRLAFGESSFLYGLPELNRAQIAQARSEKQNIANPGCFATCIQLGLLPAAQEQVLPQEIHTSAITGSTGAGQSLAATSHFSWRSGNVQVYKPFTHQHLAEIHQSLRQLQPEMDSLLHFIPYRGSFTRGILASSYFHCALNLEEAQTLYRTYYAGHPFVHLVESSPDVKQVVNTNKCLLYLEKHGDMLLVISVLDNLLKGASGQAVQNMNILFGVEETAGLHLKAVAF